MCKWQHWLVPGLVTVAVLTALAVLLRAAPIEADIAGRAGTALETGHPWAAIAVDGRDVSLAGTAPTPEAIEQAAETVRATAGVRAVTVAATPLPLQDPYTLSVDWRDGKATIKGFAPDAAAREAIAAATQAALPDAEIDNRLELARGAPEGFAGLAAFTIAQLAGLGEARIELAGTRISLVGKARSPFAYQNVVAALSGGLAGAEIATLDIEPASVAPFGWSMSRGPQRLALEGFVPSQSDREQILAALREAVADAEIDDRLQIAAGLQPGIDWPAASRFMLQQLAGLAEGSVTVRDGEMTLDGRAADAGSYDRINAALAGGLPSGLSLAEATVRRPLIDPYDWSIAVAGDGTAVISGHVPNRQAGERFAEAVRRQLGADVTVTDSQEIGAGAPDGFEPAVEQAIAALGRLGQGQARLQGRALAVSGAALTGPAANEIAAGLRAGLPSGFTVETDIGVRPVGSAVDDGECQDRLTESSQRDSIRFETGSASISTASFGLLDRIAFTMRHCPQAGIEVGGHTDAEGSDEANLALSTARARSVVAYLVRAGIFPSRLVAKGYGESLPVADNATEEGRKRNRRIEFRVIC